MAPPAGALAGGPRLAPPLRGLICSAVRKPSSCRSPKSSPPWAAADRRLRTPIHCHSGQMLGLPEARRRSRALPTTPTRPDPPSPQPRTRPNPTRPQHLRRTYPQQLWVVTHIRTTSCTHRVTHRRPLAPCAQPRPQPHPGRCTGQPGWSSPPPTRNRSRATVSTAPADRHNPLRPSRRGHTTPWGSPRPPRGRPQIQSTHPQVFHGVYQGSVDNSGFLPQLCTAVEIGYFGRGKTVVSRGHEDLSGGVSKRRGRWRRSG